MEATAHFSAMALVFWKVVSCRILILAVLRTLNVLVAGQRSSNAFVNRRKKCWRSITKVEKTAPTLGF